MSNAFLLRRAVQSVIVLFGALTLVFVLIRLAPGDPVIRMAGPDASLEEIDRMRSTLGYDKPIPVQYAIFLGNALKGDLGQSLHHHRPATELVLERLPATAELASLSMALAIVVALPLGIIAAIKRGTFIDTLATTFSLIGQSVPTFWLGIVLIIVCSVRLRLLPTSGRGGWEHIILPAVTLGLYMMALITRLTRSSMLEVLCENYVQVARAKGLSERVVIIRHALRNSLIPVVTVIGLQTGTLLSGAIITEAVFAWPGIGQLAINAIYTLDYPMIQAIVVLSGIVFVVINMVLDMLYVVIDPRIRYN